MGRDAFAGRESHLGTLNKVRHSERLPNGGVSRVESWSYLFPSWTGPPLWLKNT
jgi:hypothetical protein